MSYKGKDTAKTTTGKGNRGTPNTLQGIDDPNNPLAGVTGVVVVKPVKVEKQKRTGNSDPSLKGKIVATVWGTCIEMTIANGGVMPRRAEMHVAAMQKGVTFNTAKTQVQDFRRWYRSGGKGKVPHGVQMSRDA